METESHFIKMINQRNTNISFSTSVNLVKSKKSSFTQEATTTESLRENYMNYSIGTKNGFH